MALRALKKINNATIGTGLVAVGQTVRAGFPVILSGSDTDIAEAPAGSDLMVGIALGAAGQAFTAGQQVQVLHPNVIVPMPVGTGGATRGAKLVLVANGITTAPAHDSSGATDTSIVGIAMQTGIAGDWIGVMPTFTNRGSA